MEKTISRNPSNAIKADALLRSVMDSISSPSSTPPPAGSPSSGLAGAVEPSSSPSPPSAPTTPAPSATMQSERKKALTDALFGTLGSIKADSDARSSMDNKQVIAQPPLQQATMPAASTPEHHSSSNSRSQSRSHSHSQSSPSPSPSPSPPLTSQEPSTPSIPKIAAERLHHDISRQAAAATAALKSPSTTTFAEDHTPKRKSTKKITTSRISSPMLVSSSTSVDAIPITSPSMISLHSGSSPATSSKFSLKRLRGTLRSRPPPTGDEVTPWIDPTTPPAVQYAQYPQTPVQAAGTPRTAPALGTPSSSSRDVMRPDFKFPPTPMAQVPPVVPSTPPPSAPAAPRSAGFKGLMSRIRRAPRREDDPVTPDNNAKSSARFEKTPSRPSPPANAVATESNPQSRTSTDLLNRSNSSGSVGLARSLSARAPSHKKAPPTDPFVEPDSPEPPQVSSGGDQAALKQLYDAASKLGYDQSALSEFLSRSGSITSTHRATDSRADVRSPDLGLPSPTLEDGHPHLVSGSADASSSVPLARPQYPPRSASDTGEVPGNTVLRRTLYITSDLKPSDEQSQNTTPTRKGFVRHGHKRSASVTSVLSSRSVVDRAPTPPPTRAARRKSTEPSPPVPQLPSAYTQAAKTSPTRPRGSTTT